MMKSYLCLWWNGAFYRVQINP